MIKGCSFISPQGFGHEMSWQQKGGGKGGAKGGGWTPRAPVEEEEDLVWNAVSEALAPIASLETEWDTPKLEKRIKQYFRNASKNLEFHAKPWNLLIEEYTDTVFASIFQALHDRSWLNQVDFLMVFDAAIKELFPKHVLAHVPAPSFERCVLQAHDRAFEEQRFAPMLWEVLFTKLPDKSTKNRVYNAVEAARKEAAISGTSNGGNPVEEFTSAWLGFSIQKLRAECGAMLESVLPPHVAAEIFHGLIQ
ncbi:unnamed protein product, partial [Polarella glacialis]